MLQKGNQFRLHYHLPMTTQQFTRNIHLYYRYRYIHDHHQASDLLTDFSFGTAIFYYVYMHCINYWNLQFWNNLFNIKSKILLPQGYVTFSDFDYPV